MNMLYEERREEIDHETGEVKTSMKLTSVKHDNEPNYIKLYISDLCKLKDIPKTGNEVLNELLTLTDYNNEIILSLGVKKRIYQKLNIKKGTFDNNLSKLKAKNILKWIDTGIYQLNPNIFGKGKWQDIKKIRATWEYSSKGRELNKVETDTHEQTTIDFDDEVA